ncbi:hypothetical protein JMJ77_0010795 [Colletotrichum scovillei]|uniref:Uncharacterized protein n=1 Tax=Colletotrichum scovillei TaxID=1209932 RepID=A0A9P7R2S9_9PEZI|nr:hypothetical protein JMJ77_0010795 [Colletotrichum scovillei]KAG7059762.1 hypothetical protein JMJ78_0015051 [Colletotrichum scovillei]KAG7067208.1 hypothetical protein JMJ76_0008651 [Colletotrichum scovillei]
MAIATAVNNTCLSMYDKIDQNFSHPRKKANSNPTLLSNGFICLFTQLLAQWSNESSPWLLLRIP